MDGVLADFDTGYAAAFGPHGGKEADNAEAAIVRWNANGQNRSPVSRARQREG